MSNTSAPRLSRDQVQALKFAAHRQLTRWSNKSKLSARQRHQRTALSHAICVLQDRAFANGCELHVPRGDVDA